MTHRTLFSLTNGRVWTFINGGLACLAFSYYMQQKRDIVSEYDKTSIEAAAYYRHLENTLKWTWAVYEHHPAYKNNHKVHSSTTQGDSLAFAKLREFKGKRHFLDEEDRLKL